MAQCVRRNRTAKLTFALSVLVVSSLSALHPSGASEKSDALVKEGTALRRSGRDYEAVRKLQAAYDLDPTPKSAAQLGLCLQALGRWSEADGKLAEAISATTDAWIRKNRDTLKESLEVVKTHVGRIEVLGEPAGAVVTVSGVTVGKLPLQDAIPVNEGLIDVEVTAVGFVRDRQKLTISGGTYQRLVVRLEKTAAVATQPLEVKPATDEPSANHPALDTLVATSGDRPESTPLLRSPWFWGGVAAVVVAGIVTAIVIGSTGTSDPSYTEIGKLE